MLQFPEAVEKLVLVCAAGLGKEATLVLRITAVPWLGEILTRPSLNGTKGLLKEFVTACRGEVLPQRISVKLRIETNVGRAWRPTLL